MAQSPTVQLQIWVKVDTNLRMLLLCLAVESSSGGGWCKQPVWAIIGWTCHHDLSVCSHVCQWAVGRTVVSHPQDITVWLGMSILAYTHFYCVQSFSLCILLCYSVLACHMLLSSGVTMGWLLRLVTGGPTGGRGPPTVLEFLVINFSVLF